MKNLKLKLMFVLPVVLLTGCIFDSPTAPSQQQQQQQQTTTVNNTIIVQVPTPVTPTPAQNVNVTFYLRSATCSGEEIAGALVTVNGTSSTTSNNGRTSSFSVLANTNLGWSASKSGYDAGGGTINSGAGGDFQIYLTRQCNPGTPPPPTTPPPPAVDVCPNISGVQESIPSGMIKDVSGNCVVPPTDVCPNIAGVQESIPSGMIKDASGNCVVPPVCTHSLATTTITAADYHAFNGSIEPGGTCPSTMVSNVSWFVLATGAGSGNWSSSYNGAENPDVAARSGVVTVTWSDGFVRTIPVTQPGKPAATCSYSVTTAGMDNVSKSGGQGTLIIGVNGPNPNLCTWSVTVSNPIMIGVTPSSGAGNAGSGTGGPVVTIGGNYSSTNPRDETITVTGLNGFRAVINVHQAG